VNERERKCGSWAEVLGWRPVEVDVIKAKDPEQQPL